MDSILNEYGVLGSLLIDPSLFPEAAELPDDMFSSVPLQEIFRAMPQAERFEHYKRIDEAVSAVHTGLIHDAREAGTKINESKSKEFLDNAADRVVESLINGTFA